LCVLVLQALPLTWRRIVLVSAVLGGFVLLFPLRVVRSFYALEFPRDVLGETLLIGALGIAAMLGFWVLSRRRGRGPAGAARG
jgi:hypothetical protein